jgi:hypothetical protein
MDRGEEVYQEMDELAYRRLTEEFIPLLKPIKSVNRSTSAYSLKHLAEGYFGRVDRGKKDAEHTYVYMWVFHDCMEAAGFKSYTVGDSPNPHYNVSKKSIYAIQEFINE